MSLKGSPTVSPTTVALWTSVPLPPRKPSSTFFLALSQLAPAVRHEDCEQLAGQDRAAEEAAERTGAEAETDQQRGEYGEDRRAHQLFLRARRNDIDAAAIVRQFLAFHDAGMLAELAADFEHDLISRAPDRLDCKRAEQERHRAADQQADEDASGY